MKKTGKVCKECKQWFGHIRSGSMFCSIGCYHKSPNSEVGKYQKGHPGLPGEKNPSWKGGIINHHSGYKKIKLPEPKKYQIEHRHIMEKHLGRKLNRDEHIHHINGNKSDNRIENMRIMSVSEHTKLHWKIRKTSLTP